MKKIVFGMAAAAAFALPAEAQIWKRGDVVTQSGDRVIRRTDTSVDGARCVRVDLDRYGDRRTEQLCDWDRDGVYGDSDDHRLEARRREEIRRNGGIYRSGTVHDRVHDDGVHRNRGQARAAEVHARNEARKREKQRQKAIAARSREIEKQRREADRELDKRERELDKRRKELEKEERKHRAKHGRW